MTAGSTATPLASSVALLERAMSYTLGGLTLVTRQSMGEPTPCAGWDLRALLSHLNDSLLALRQAIAVGHVGLDPVDSDGGTPGDDPVAGLRTRAGQVIGAWAGVREAGEVLIAEQAIRADVVAATGAVEIAVHGWDVIRACGQDRPVPSGLAEELLALSHVLVSDDDRPVRFGWPVPVSPLAGPSDQLIALLGRRPW